jgi:thioredoxin reductase (NADPH)
VQPALSVLTEIEIDRARPYGRVRQAELGEILYRPGEVGVPCFILLSASLEIVQPTIHGERLVFNLCPGMFTGEAGMIAGQRTVVQARVMQGGEILELRPEELRTLVARDAGLVSRYESRLRHSTNWSQARHVQQRTPTNLPAT